MSYLILQIWFFLLLAALIGLLAGWLFRGGSKGKIKKINQDWSQRLANVEAERDEHARNKLTALNQLCALKIRIKLPLATKPSS